jgi:hypothetical protein
MEPDGSKYQGWCVDGHGTGGDHDSDEDDDNHSAGAPVDLELIAQAYETDDFWLPSYTRAPAQNKVDAHASNKSSSTTTASLQRAGDIVTSLAHQGSYVRRCVSISSSITDS